MSVPDVRSCVGGSGSTIPRMLHLPPRGNSTLPLRECGTVFLQMKKAAETEPRYLAYVLGAVVNLNHQRDFDATAFQTEVYIGKRRSRARVRRNCFHSRTASSAKTNLTNAPTFVV